MNDIKVRHQEILGNAVYTPCEVASLLKLGLEATYRYIRTGRIPSFCIDPSQKRPRRLISGSDLINLINGQKSGRCKK
jgi:hypothetical protein